MSAISQIKLLDNTTYDIKDANVPHSSLPAASGGADLSLVTTGEKYLWGQAGASSLASLSDVTITTPANNNILQYDAANNIWINTDGKADRVPLPAEYDATSTYAVGDFCTYNGNAYVCQTTISTPEAWDSSHWILDSQQDYLHSINPSGIGSFSLNRRNGTTVGILSFAAGRNGTASGNYSHAEGDGANATGMSSHAEGISTTASREGSHAEGAGTVSSNVDTHAEGWKTTASGVAAHAEGSWTIAKGDHSHAEGYYTTAKFAYQHVFGEYNVVDPASTYSNYRGNYVEIVGNGTADDARSNARTLDWSGNEELSGTLTTPGCNIQDSSQVTTISLTGSTGDITATSLNGVTIGATPQFTDTTYSAGTGLDLSGTAFSVKTGFTTSGNDRAVQTDANGNLYVTQKDDDTTYTLGTSGNDVTLTPSSGTAQSITVPYATTAGSLQSNSFPDVTVNTTAMPVSGGKITGLEAGTSKIFTDGIGISNPATANDVGWIRVTGTGESDTVLELATGDDGGTGEQIVARQYNTSNAVAREVKILDSNGDTILPYEMKISSASGQIQKKVVGSYCSSQTTVAALLNEVRYSNGCCGSVNLTAYSGSPSTVPANWYNFQYIPHRWGGNHGAADGDNCNYGTLMLYGMTGGNSYQIRYASGSIQYCRELYTRAHADTAATANQLVLRDGNGDTRARYAYVTHINQSSSEQTSSYDGTSGYLLYCDSSNWVRKARAVTSLYSGNLAPNNQCSWANYKSYNVYIVSATPDGGNSRYMYAIPRALFSSSRGDASVYACVSDQYWMVFYMYYSGTTGYCYCGSNNNSNARIKAIYGVV